MNKKKKKNTGPTNKDLTAEVVNKLRLLLLSQINLPFMYAVACIQHDFKLPIISTGKSDAIDNFSGFKKNLLKQSDDFTLTPEFRSRLPIASILRKINAPDSWKKEVAIAVYSDLPYQKFERMVEKLRDYFDLSHSWQFHLEFLIVTNNISAPQNEIESPTLDSLEQLKVFHFNAKKKAQHNYLREMYGFKETNRKDESKSISELISSKDYMPNEELIHDYNQIADLLYGELDYDKMTDEEITIESNKRISKIKQKMSRINKSNYSKGLSQEEMARIDKLLRPDS